MPLDRLTGKESAEIKLEERLARLARWAIELSRPTRERGALSAKVATERVICACQWIEKPNRGAWIRKVLPRVEQALEKERVEKEKKDRQKPLRFQGRFRF